MNTSINSWSYKVRLTKCPKTQSSLLAWSQQVNCMLGEFRYVSSSTHEVLKAIYSISSLSVRTETVQIWYSSRKFWRRRGIRPLPPVHSLSVRLPFGCTDFRIDSTPRIQRYDLRKTSKAPSPWKSCTHTFESSLRVYARKGAFCIGRSIVHVPEIDDIFLSSPDSEWKSGVACLRSAVSFSSGTFTCTCTIFIGARRFLFLSGCGEPTSQRANTSSQTLFACMPNPPRVCSLMPLPRFSASLPCPAFQALLALWPDCRRSAAKSRCKLVSVQDISSSRSQLLHRSRSAPLTELGPNLFVLFREIG